MDTATTTIMANAFGTYTCRCGHTAVNYPTSGWVDDDGAHHAEDSAQMHARFHADMYGFGYADGMADAAKGTTAALIPAEDGADYCDGYRTAQTAAVHLRIRNLVNPA